jgi:hypothetical protein
MKFSLYFKKISLLFKSNDTSIVRSQDETNLIVSISNNKIGKILVWDFVAENWDQLFKRFE